MKALALALLLALPLAGCYSSSVEQGPGGQTTSTSGPGFFQETDQWALPKASESRAYEFVNPTGNAYAQFTAQLSAGQVTVRVLDAEGDLVWSDTATGPGQSTKQGQTKPGEPGVWRVTRETTSLSGQITITLQAN